MARVTVQIDDAVVTRIRQLADAKKTTFDEMLDRLLRVATLPGVSHDELLPNTRSAAGILKGLPDRPYKDLLSEALLEKYGFEK